MTCCRAPIADVAVTKRHKVLIFLPALHPGNQQSCLQENLSYNNARQTWRNPVTVVWNNYLLIFWPNVIFYYTRSWKPNANNQICWITKVSTHSKTLIQFCWKFIYFKDVYWWCLKIWICDKMRALFIFQIIDYAWISIMLFDLCWKW